MERKKQLRSAPEKTRAWRERSVRKAREKLRTPPPKQKVEHVREMMSKANPPKPVPHESKRKPQKPSNPGNNPTPPLTPGAVCICCGRRAVQNHHVTFRQQLRRLRVDAGAPESCVPVCLHCHARHHDGTPWKIPLAVIPDDRIQFALAAMGPACYDYLLRRYLGDDPRLESLISEAEGAEG